MKIRSVALAIATACLVTSGSGPSADASSISSAYSNAIIPQFTVGVDFQEPTLDQTKNLPAVYITSLALETLLRLGPQGQLEPELATSWDEPNPVTYVYHLRHDVKFWDGEDLTAADVVYSLNYTLAPGSQDAFGLPNVKSVTARGPYAVVVTLARPDASWKYWAAEPYSEVFEAKLAETHKGTFGNPQVLVMGTGPWEIDSLDPTTGAELSANQNWWGGQVPIEKISFKFFSSQTSEALAFRAGEVDLDQQVLSASSFASTSGAKLMTTPSCDNGFFSMSTQDPPWNDVHVRRAAAYALNRASIITAAGGYASPIYTLIPPVQLRTIASAPQVNALLNSVPLYKYNVTKAKEEMAQSAYPHGVKATMLGDTSGTDADVDQVIASELQAVGIDVQLKLGSINTWQLIETGPADKRMTTYSGGGCFSPDPSNYTDWLGSKNLQVGQYNTADYAPPRSTS